MTTDPPVRKDGLCACGCGKKRPIVAADPQMQRRLRRYAGSQAETDPLATSRCARRYHGTELASDVGVDEETLEAREEVGRVSKENWRGALGDPMLA